MTDGAAESDDHATEASAHLAVSSAKLTAIQNEEHDSS